MTWIYAVSAPPVAAMLVLGWLAQAVVGPSSFFASTAWRGLFLAAPLFLPFLVVWMQVNLTAPRRRGVENILACLPGGRLTEAAVALGWNEWRWRVLQRICVVALTASFVIVVVASVVWTAQQP